jgi:hypothetical protein
MRVQTEALWNRSGRPTPRRARLAVRAARRPRGCAFPSRCAHQGCPRSPDRHVELLGSSSATHGVAHRSVRAPLSRTPAEAWDLAPASAVAGAHLEAAAPIYGWYPAEEEWTALHHVPRQCRASSSPGRPRPSSAWASPWLPRASTAPLASPDRASAASQHGPRQPPPPAAGVPLAGRLPGPTDPRNRALGGWGPFPHPSPAAGVGELAEIRPPPPGVTLRGEENFWGLIHKIGARLWTCRKSRGLTAKL